MSGKLQFFVLFMVMTLLGNSLAQFQSPPNPCPQVFRYRMDPWSQTYYGEIAVQKPMNVPVYYLEVNMTVNEAVAQGDGISINIVSRQQEIINGPILRYVVKFPRTRAIPYLTEIKLNGYPLCYGEQPPFISGAVQSAMWAASTIRTSIGYPERVTSGPWDYPTINNNDELPGRFPSYQPTPDPLDRFPPTYLPYRSDPVN